MALGIGALSAVPGVILGPTPDKLPSYQTAIRNGDRICVPEGAMVEDFVLYVAVGFAAQLVDGAIGMAYGLSATTVCSGPQL